MHMFDLQMYIYIYINNDNDNNDTDNKFISFPIGSNKMVYSILGVLFGSFNPCKRP